MLRIKSRKVLIKKTGGGSDSILSVQEKKLSGLRKETGGRDWPRGPESQFLFVTVYCTPGQGFRGRPVGGGGGPRPPHSTYNAAKTANAAKVPPPCLKPPPPESDNGPRGPQMRGELQRVWNEGGGF